MYYNPSVGTYLGYVSNGQGGVVQLCSTLSLPCKRKQLSRPLFVVYWEPIFTFIWSAMMGIHAPSSMCYVMCMFDMVVGLQAL